MLKNIMNVINVKQLLNYKIMMKQFFVSPVKNFIAKSVGNKYMMVIVGKNNLEDQLKRKIIVNVLSVIIGLKKFMVVIILNVFVAMSFVTIVKKNGLKIKNANVLKNNQV